jgi:hypothetical protein
MPRTGAWRTSAPEQTCDGLYAPARAWAGPPSVPEVVPPDPTSAPIRGRRRGARRWRWKSMEGITAAFMARNETVGRDAWGTRSSEASWCTPLVVDEWWANVPWRPGRHLYTSLVCTRRPGVHVYTSLVYTRRPGVHVYSSLVYTRRPDVHVHTSLVYTRRPGGRMRATHRERRRGAPGGGGGCGGEGGMGADHVEHVPRCAGAAR